MFSSHSWRCERFHQGMHSTDEPTRYAPGRFSMSTSFLFGGLKHGEEVRPVSRFLYLSSPKIYDHSLNNFGHSLKMYEILL